MLPTQTLWVTANSSSPVVYDLRSGINVTEFVDTDEERTARAAGRCRLRWLLYSGTRETKEVFAVTNRRSLIIWRFNDTASVTTLSRHTDVVESLTFSRVCGVNCILSLT